MVCGLFFSGFNLFLGERERTGLSFVISETLSRASKVAI